MTRRTSAFTLALLATLLTPLGATAQDRLCDTGLEDCRQPILDLINAEPVTGGIDAAFWLMEDNRYATALVNAHNRGVPVRVLVDERGVKALADDPHADVMAGILTTLRNAGIPMREKVPDPTYAIQILHFKMFLFYGQNTVEFSKANFNPDEYVPTATNNYSDESVFFTKEIKIVDSFKRRFDDLWTNTTVYQDYANISAAPVRKCPLADPSCVIDSSMNFPPIQDFAVRTKSRIDLEPSGGSIDAVVYRITDHLLPDAVIAALNRGVGARIMIDYGEYRNVKRRWDAAHVDRMYMAGAQVKSANHGGIGHQASIILHGKGEVIFGSSNWTTPSANQQDEHNYFYTKGSLSTETPSNPWFFNWFSDQFERRWNDYPNYIPFVPLPPDAPVYASPLNAAGGVGSSITLKWEGGPWAQLYDIYFGTTPTPPLLASNLQIGSPDDGVKESYTISNLQPGTTYYWKIVSKTFAQKTKCGDVWSFLTAGGTPPPSNAYPNGTPWPIPGTVQAENFDNGGQNVAYYDTSAGNTYGAYRSTDVDIEASSGGGFDVAKVKAGEWLNYTVNVATTGTYQFTARVATVGSGATIRVFVDGTDVSGSSGISAPDTGGWQTWANTAARNVSLTAGLHLVRIYFATVSSSGGGSNLDSFTFSQGSQPPPPSYIGTPFPGPAPAAIPGQFEAENFDNGGQNVSYFDTSAGNVYGAYRSTDVDIEATADVGGGFDVAKTKVGEWMKYTISVATGGSYTLQARVADLGAGASFRISVDDVAVGTFAVPDTGGWQSWTTAIWGSVPIQLTAGTHVFKIEYLTAGSGGGAANFNWFALQ